MDAALLRAQAAHYFAQAHILGHTPEATRSLSIAIDYIQRAQDIEAAGILLKKPWGS